MDKESLMALYKSGQITAEEYVKASIWASDVIWPYVLLAMIFVYAIVRLVGIAKADRLIK